MASKLMHAAFVVALIVSANIAAAATTAVPGADLDRAKFEAVKAQIIAQLSDEKYREITPEDKQTVIAALNRISARLETPGPLGDQEAVDTFNDQELINNITSHAERESRLYCQRNQLTGSHIFRVICLTVAQWKKREIAGQQVLGDIQHNQRQTHPGAE